jgi:hypothetical protein
LFLRQLIEALRLEEAGPAPEGGENADSAVAAECSRTAALHGKAMLEQGYAVDLVVYSYGDICQAITELAEEKQALLTLDEFRALSRLLDNAMADAVSSFARHRELMRARGVRDAHERMAAMAQEQRALLDTALRAFEAQDLGDINLTGTMESVLQDSLRKLRDLQDPSPPERLAGPSASC